MNKSKLFTVKRAALAAALLVGSVMVAPAFAHSHVSVSLGIGVPGVNVGYNDGYRDDYGYYRPAYYPAPRVVYYNDPVVYERPVYVRQRYENRVIYRDDYGYSDGYRYRGHHEHEHEHEHDDGD
jgi:hypothetical protein